MAKFSIEIDLDYINEDGSIEEAIYEQILSKVQTNVSASVQDKLLKGGQEKIEDAINSQISTTLQQRIEALLDMPRTITDDYGRTKIENVTLDQMITSHIDKLLSGKKMFDSDGKYQSSDYSAKFTAFELFAEKKMIPAISAQVTALAARTEKEITILIENKVKGQVAENLAKFILNNSQTLSLKS